MEYRLFKDEERRVSLLGFGTMRLPKLTDGSDGIDEAKAIEIIRHSIDNGINYVDTAYMYHGGNSEVVTGKALKDGYREKVFLADKMPVWMATDEADVERIFNDQLKKLDVACIDFYLVHNITTAIWARVKNFKTLEFLEAKKAEGKIKYIGFSFHDELPFFKEVLDSYAWDFCQIQLNYMDVNFQAGLEGLQYAASKGVPVIVMEPLKGGKLTDKIPEVIQKIWDKAEIKRSPAEWAFKWVTSQPGVFTILSGMSDLAQVQENLKIFSGTNSAPLTPSELETVSEVSKEYNMLIKASCTSCQYCMPCPVKIDIPTYLNFYNEWFLFDKNPKIISDLKMFTNPKSRPEHCTTCRACEEKCPQHLPISDLMKAITSELPL